MRSQRILGFSLLLGTVAPAQSIQNGGAEADPAFRKPVQEAFLTYEASLSTHCGRIEPDWSQARKTIYGRPVFAGGRLTDATWSESVPGTACGQPRHFRALVVIHDGRMKIMPQLPGTSNVTPLLEHDVRIAVAGALKVHDPHLDATDHMDVVDTQLLGAIPAPHASWREVWTVAVKNRRLRVPIEFLPDRTGPGTSYHVDPSAITDSPVR